MVCSAANAQTLRGSSRRTLDYLGMMGGSLVVVYCNHSPSSVKSGGTDFCSYKGHACNGTKRMLVTTVKLRWWTGMGTACSVRDCPIPHTAMVTRVILVNLFINILGISSPFQRKTWKDPNLYWSEGVGYYSPCEGTTSIHLGKSTHRSADSIIIFRILFCICHALRKYLEIFSWLPRLDFCQV